MLEVDSGLIEDLLELLSSSGVEKRFLKRLEKYLQQLREDGEKAIGEKRRPDGTFRRVKFFVFDAFSARCIEY